ncbi:uncharacterized protein [Aristolochia californica]|uniref:uncharacterized protein n=1 Tax=Aristolochia californica TaxID=171875 RepID=UPI0035DF2C31
MAWTSPPRSPFSAVRLPSTNEVFPPEEEAALAFSDRRTVYLVNIFIANTARFLNRFSSICEEKLADVHRRILRLDATLLLLEAKLRSIDQDGVSEDHGQSKDLGSSSNSIPVASSSSMENSPDLPSGSGFQSV